jgi:hypothetical protein
MSPCGCKAVGTDAFDVMWGTDGTCVLTAEAGMWWVFAAVGCGLSLRVDQGT